MGNSNAGLSLLEKKQKLDTFGTDDGAFERIPMAATSVVYFDKAESIARKVFFREKNKVTSAEHLVSIEHDVNDYHKYQGRC
jgi:hypothetical protein